MRLILSNYKFYEKYEIEFNKNMILLSGVSGIGKTTIIQSILFCLFGEKGNINNFKNSSSSKTKVELIIDDLKIERTRNPKKLTLYKKQKKYENELAQNIINEYTNMSYKDIFSFQDSFIDLTPQYKFTFLEKICDIQNSKIKNNLQSKILDCQKELNEKEIELRTNENIFKQQLVPKEKNIQKKDYISHINMYKNNIKDLNDKIILNNQNILLEKEKNKKIIFLENEIISLQNEFKTNNEDINELEKLLDETKKYEKYIDAKNNYSSLKEIKIDINNIKSQINEHEKYIEIKKKINTNIDDSSEYEKILNEYNFLKDNFNFSKKINVRKIDYFIFDICPNCNKNIKASLNENKIFLSDENSTNKNSLDEYIISQKFQRFQYLQSKIKKNTSIEQIHLNRKYKEELNNIMLVDTLNNLKKQENEYFSIKSEKEKYLKIINSYDIKNIKYDLSSKDIEMKIGEIKNNINKNNLINNQIKKYKKEIEILKSKNFNINDDKELNKILINYQKELKELEYKNEQLNLNEKYELWNNKLITTNNEKDKLLEEYNNYLKIKDIINITETTIFQNILTTINININYFLNLFFEESIKYELSFSEENNYKKIIQTIFFKNIEYNLDKMSTGELARLNLSFFLSIATIFNFPIILLDEKIVNLDQDNGTKIYSLIKQNFINKKIIVIAHNTIEGIFDEIKYLN